MLPSPGTHDSAHYLRGYADGNKSREGVTADDLDRMLVGARRLARHYEGGLDPESSRDADYWRGVHDGILDQLRLRHPDEAPPRQP